MRRVVPFFLLLLAAVPLHGQVGVTTDLITGVVTDPQGLPVAGATVEVISFGARVLRGATTDRAGRYRILFPERTGRYQVFVRALGYRGIRTIARRRAADDDRIEVNAQLSVRPVEVDSLTVRGGASAGPELPTPGESELVQTLDRLARIPLDPSDLSAAASLAPSVTPVSGSDTVAASFSVAGQGPNANSITLDGLTFGLGSVPPDAVRQTRVITNTYDVARGQFSGGLVSANSRSGTNRLLVTAHGGLRDPAFAWAGNDPARQTAAVQQLSAGVGGPIVRDRLFYYIAGLARHRDDRLLSASTLTPTGAGRFGLAPDSLSRFLALVDSLGLPGRAPSDPQSVYLRDLSVLARADWVVSDGQTLSLRGDWRRNDQDAIRILPLATSASGGTQTSSGGGVMLTWSSKVGRAFLNEAKGYLSGASLTATPYLALPFARVQVGSLLADGAIASSTLNFGGSNALPLGARTSGFEMNEEVSWLPGAAGHRVRAGLFYTTTDSRQTGGANLTGTYTYGTLKALEAGRPSSFTRTLVAPGHQGRVSTEAFYLGDVWRPLRSLQVTYGIRGEHSWSEAVALFDPAIDSLFGLRTDQLPAESRLSPRAGFTWSRAATPDAPSLWSARGGVGLFRGPLPLTLLTAAAPSLDGGTEVRLSCAGASTPVPDWSGFLLDPSVIPDQCAGPPSPSSAGVPASTIFGAHVDAPRALRVSLGLGYRPGPIQFGLEWTHATGRGQSGFIDRNLGPVQFTLDAERGREVFALPTSIDTNTGAVALGASRIYPTYGQVLEVTSQYRNRSTAVAFSASGTIARRLAFNASYTWSETQDQVSALGVGGRVGSTGLDPLRPAFGPADFDRRHQFVGTVFAGLGNGLELTTLWRLMSGSPYTPSVAGDVNGDGSRNDRAFIPDPAVADPAVAAGIAALLARGSPHVKECLGRQLGKVATRNSCRGPWQPSLDLQLNYRPRSLAQRLTVSLVTNNFLAGVDRALHGAGGILGWGQLTRPDPVLLTVKGFDRATNSFRYEVNERFGGTTGSNGSGEAPFQVGIQARISLGATRPGRGGAGGGGLDPDPTGPRDAADAGELFLDRFAFVIRDPVAPIEERAVLLHLTDPQSTALDSLSQRFATSRDSLTALVLTQISRAGVDPDTTVLMAQLRPRLAAGRRLRDGTLDAAKVILTDAQWAMLPAELRPPPRNGGGGQRVP